MKPKGLGRGLDALLGGGLPLAALHEVRALESREGGAAVSDVIHFPPPVGRRRWNIVRRRARAAVSRMQR